MFKRIVLAAALISAPAIVAVAPADRVSSEIAVYVEGAAVAEGLTSMRTLVGTIAGEGVWSIMAANFEQRTGINLLEPERLEAIGINTKQGWGLALNVELMPAGNAKRPEFVMIIPSSAGNKFYDFLKTKVIETQMPVSKELEAGKLFHFGSENDPGYILRSDDAVLVGNQLEMIKAMANRASQPLSSAPFYTSMRAHLKARNQNKDPLAAFYLNPKLIVSSLKAQSELLRNIQKELNKGNENAPVIDDNSPYIAEIRDNLQSSGGAFVANAEKVSFYFSYKYKDGYLADLTKIYPRIIQVKTAPLASDSLTRNPLHYSLLKFNLLGAIELFKSLSPVFAEKYNRNVAEIKTQMDLDLEKEILGSLRGNFNFQVLSIPPEAKTKDIQAWELYGAFGIQPGTGDNWIKLFKAMRKMAKKAEASKPKKTKFEFDEDETGKFVIITGEEKVAGKRKAVTVVALIRDSEVVISNSRANAVKATKSSATTLSERLIKTPYDAAQGIFFVDLQQIFRYAMKSKEAASLKSYAAMLEKLKYFAIISSIQGDFATAETSLQLKK